MPRAPRLLRPSTGWQRLGAVYLRAFMSFGEAFLQVSALTTTMSMPLELTIRKRPSAVKSMPTTAPDTYDGQPRRFHVFANSRHAGVDNTSAGNERLITGPIRRDLRRDKQRFQACGWRQGLTDSIGSTSFSSFCVTVLRTLHIRSFLAARYMQYSPHGLQDKPKSKTRANPALSKRSSRVYFRNYLAVTRRRLISPGRQRTPSLPTRPPPCPTP